MRVILLGFNSSKFGSYWVTQSILIKRNVVSSLSLTSTYEFIHMKLNLRIEAFPRTRAVRLPGTLNPKIRVRISVGPCFSIQFACPSCSSFSCDYITFACICHFVPITFIPSCSSFSCHYITFACICHFVLYYLALSSLHHITF